jgi:hypothetical protein
MASALPDDFWEVEDQENAELGAIVAAKGLGQFNETADYSEVTDEVTEETGNQEEIPMETEVTNEESVTEETGNQEETDDDEAVRKLTERKDKNFY